MWRRTRLRSGNKMRQLEKSEGSSKYKWLYICMNTNTNGFTYVMYEYKYKHFCFNMVGSDREKTIQLEQSVHNWNTIKACNSYQTNNLKQTKRKHQTLNTTTMMNLPLLSNNHDTKTQVDMRNKTENLMLLVCAWTLMLCWWVGHTSLPY